MALPAPRHHSPNSLLGTRAGLPLVSNAGRNDVNGLSWNFYLEES